MCPAGVSAARSGRLATGKLARLPMNGRAFSSPQYDISKRFRTRALKQSDNTYRFDFSRKQEFGGTPPAPASMAEREQKKIGAIQLSGEQQFSREQLTKWLSARQGKNYDFFKIRRGVERITGKYAGEGFLKISRRQIF